MTSKSLSPDQVCALFDILSHHEAYQELRDLRIPGALAHSGPPFKTGGEQNQLPLLHAMFSKFILPLPGLRDVSMDFYQAKCQEIIEEFAEANLSESYEAGYIGIRKMLATAAAALVEAPARGYYGGLPKRVLVREDRRYDKSMPEDLVAGFDDFLQGLVYHDLIDQMFTKAAETDRLEEHDPLIQAAHEHILLIIASFLHHILVISPEGQTIFTMMKRANAIVPYAAIRQSLKIGNVATMINGTAKLILTKMTINSVTTFLGITNASDSGWNILQTIISTIMNWDTSALKRRSVEIEESSDGPSIAQRDVLKSYVDMNREEHEKCRAMSEARAEPIVVTVLEEYGGDELGEKQIPHALEYLSLHLSLRDRKMITGILCSRQPDLLTQAVWEGVTAYYPIIQALHNAVNLSATVGDFELFMNDLLKIAPSNKRTAPPSTRDFVLLLRRHQQASHRFIHQVCKNGPEVSEWYKEYAKRAAKIFRVDSHEESVTDSGGAGKITLGLESALSKLSEKQRAQVLAECSAHAVYLSDLTLYSQSRMNVDATSAASAENGTDRVKPTSDTSSSSPTSDGRGPGIFLRRWQAYVNETSITPVQLNSPVRYGGDVNAINPGRPPGSRSTKGGQVPAAKNEETITAPSCARTVELLAQSFREILVDSGNFI